MRKLIFLVYCMMLFSSCDPDVSGEGITLPPMDFGIKVSSDTAYIRLGDTLKLYSSISNTLSNGVKIDDGEALINLFFGYTNQTPITSFEFVEVDSVNHCDFIVRKGGIQFVNNTSNILNIYALPYGDSIQVEIAFVPLKKGTYTFYVQSMFYEGSKGKTRTQPKFDVINTHWELYQIPELDSLKPHPGTPDYYCSYYFAVTD